MIVSSSPPLSTFLHDLRHEIAHLFCCTFLHLARDVRVSAEREARIEVSEHTRYGFHVHAVLERAAAGRRAGWGFRPPVPLHSPADVPADLCYPQQAQHAVQRFRW